MSSHFEISNESLTDHRVIIVLLVHLMNTLMDFLGHHEHNNHRKNCIEDHSSNFFQEQSKLRHRLGS